MNDELKSNSIMIESLTDFGSFPDSGGSSEDYMYSYYPYFLAELLYLGDVKGNIKEDSIVIQPFQTVYEEYFMTATNDLMFVRG